LPLNEKTATNLFEIGIKEAANRGKVGGFFFIFHLLRYTVKNSAQYGLFGRLEDLNGLKILSQLAKIQNRSKLVGLLEFHIMK